jgi:hypothetical protein
MLDCWLFAFCLALIAGLLPGNVAQAGGEYSDLHCAIEGGSWTGTTGLGATRECEFAANTSVAVCRVRRR